MTSIWFLLSLSPLPFTANDMIPFLWHIHFLMVMSKSLSYMRNSWFISFPFTLPMQLNNIIEYNRRWQRLDSSLNWTVNLFLNGLANWFVLFRIELNLARCKPNQLRLNRFWPNQLSLNRFRDQFGSCLKTPKPVKA